MFVKLRRSLFAFAAWRSSEAIGNTSDSLISVAVSIGGHEGMRCS